MDNLSDQHLSIIQWEGVFNDDSRLSEDRYTLKAVGNLAMGNSETFAEPVTNLNTFYIETTINSPSDNKDDIAFNLGIELSGAPAESGEPTPKN